MCKGRNGRCNSKMNRTKRGKDWSYDQRRKERLLGILIICCSVLATAQVTIIKSGWQTKRAIFECFEARAVKTSETKQAPTLSKESGRSKERMQEMC
jgi:hypothetical protein